MERDSTTCAIGPVHLTSLAGLDHLQRVGGTLRIGGTLQNSWRATKKNEAGPIRLQSLAGLSALTEVGSLEIGMTAQGGTSDLLDVTLHLSDLSALEGVTLSGLTLQLAEGEVPLPAIVLAKGSTVTLNGAAIQSTLGPVWPTELQNLSLTGTRLTSLEGLENLQRTNTLVLWDNPRLSDFAGLGVTTTQNLVLSTGPVLQPLLLTQVPNEANVTGNADALSHLQQAGILRVFPDTDGSSRITSLSSLKTVNSAELLVRGQTDLSGLSALTVAQDLALSGDFQTLDGLNPALKVSSISIYRSELRSLEGLPVDGLRHLSVYQNNALSSIHGLENANVSDLYIQENPQLAQCAVDAWMRDRGLAFDDYIASGNPSGNNAFCACDLDGTPTCPDPRCHTTLPGAYTITNEADAEAIANVDCAELLYVTNGPSTLHLPNLGSAEMFIVASPTTHHIDLPNLTRVGKVAIGEFATSGGRAPLRTVSMPALTWAYDLVVASPDSLTDLDWSDLESAASLDISCSDVYVDPTPLQTLDLSGLRRADRVDIVGCTSLPACAVRADLAQATIGSLNLSDLNDGCTCDEKGAVLGCE